MITLPYNQLYRFIDNTMASFEASLYKTLNHYLIENDIHYTIKDLEGVDVQLVLQCNEDYTPVLVIDSSEYVLEELYQFLSSLKISASGYKSVWKFLQYGDCPLFQFYLPIEYVTMTLSEFDSTCDLTLNTGCVRNIYVSGNTYVSGREGVTVVELPELNNKGG